MLNERTTAPLTQRIRDILTFGSLTIHVDAWLADPDPDNIAWVPVPYFKTDMKLKYGSIEAHQRHCDMLGDMFKLLTINGVTCAVKNEVIAELQEVLGR